MTITYEVGNSLYVNITNRCTNDCDFCIRRLGDGAYGSDSLWLEREPSVEEICGSVFSHDLTKYEELVFCGYGEPAMRFYDLIEVSRRVKERSDIRIRLNTNGHANHICGRDVTPLLKDCVDCVSVSLNSADSESYEKLCHPCFPGAYDALIDFTRKSVPYVKEAVLSVVSTTLSDDDIERCKLIASRTGAKLRIREIVK